MKKGYTNTSTQLDLQIGQGINCNKQFGSLWFKGTKGFIEDKVDSLLWLSNGIERDEQCVIDINDYPDIYIMDDLERQMLLQLGI